MTAAESRDSGPAPEVRTVAGRVRGSHEAGVAVFRGIPYAQPPVGDLRLAAPRPVPGWSGVREALAFGPPPPQGGHFGMDTLSPATTDAGWLTVNVWSPEPEPGAGLPVMVWIQGGGYEIGMSGLPEYDGGRLAREGRVVVVTLNYRVGQRASRSSRVLRPTAACSTRSPRWSGCGTPSRPSAATRPGSPSSASRPAGARSRRCSPCPGPPGSSGEPSCRACPAPSSRPSSPRTSRRPAPRELGLRPTVSDLALVTPQQLSAAGDAVSAGMEERTARWGLPAHRRIPFSPVVDGDVLATTPWQALASGAGRDVDLLVGHTRDEQRLFTVISGLLGEVGEEQAAVALDLFAPGPDGARRYREAFPQAGPEELYELVHSDWLFRMPSLHLAEAQAAGGGRVHVYELTWSAPGMGGAFGACHGLDVPLVFGTLDRGQPAMLIGDPPSPEAEAVSGGMRAAWTSFAAHGDPGWPEYDTAQRLVQLVDERPEVTSDPERTSRLIWQDHTFPALPLTD